MSIAIVWFRQDLRLRDNPALYYAATENENIIPLYILNENRPWVFGDAQRWWLHHSLNSLRSQLKKLGLKLILRKGNPAKIFLELAKNKKMNAVYWNDCYEPDAIIQDKKIKTKLIKLGIKIKNYNGSLLYKPCEIINKKGEHFKVFTPFWKACCHQAINMNILTIPKLKQAKVLKSEVLNTWKLLPAKPNWAKGFDKIWQPGELHAKKQLNQFVSKKLTHYSKHRDFPAHDVTSLLSPHLHFGEISPRQIFAVIKQIEIHNKDLFGVCEHFLRELGWREFSYHLLYHFPATFKKNFREQFDSLPWSNNKKLLSCWQKGKTGFPIVDAGMRQLWHTGYMHNRVRMIVASFLTKDLLIDWRYGAKWFWNTLVDADLASNTMNWQWVAGSGVDAAPYFRIFNPILQGKKYDPKGEYVRYWVPELAKIPNEYIHEPWLTPSKLLKEMNFSIGKNYPQVIVDHEIARKKALSIYKKLKQK